MREIWVRLCNENQTQTLPSFFALLLLYLILILLSFQTLALQRYTCQLARLHIDMYIFDMLSQSPISRNVSSETLVTGKKEPHHLGRHLPLIMFASSTIIMIRIII